MQHGYKEKPVLLSSTIVILPCSSYMIVENLASTHAANDNHCVTHSLGSVATDPLSLGDGDTITLMSRLHGFQA